MHEAIRPRSVFYPALISQKVSNYGGGVFAANKLNHFSVSTANEIKSILTIDN